MDPNQMLPRSFPMWPPSDAAPPQVFLPPPNANRGWKRKSNPGGYQPPAIADLQVQNRAKARRWFKNPNPNNNNKSRKYLFHKPKAAAPRNTTSFIIRAKRAGGIASLVSPCPVTPAVLPTPRLSPTREGLSDMAQQEWGVDGYGSMKGLIRLRSSPQPPNAVSDDDDEEENSSDSDVEEHVEVERRLDHDLSRFEMLYPGKGEDVLELEEDEEYDQDVHVARLEEENLTLKERLFLMEQEVGDMRRRLEVLESRFGADDAGAGGRENALVDDGTERDNAVAAAAGAENDIGMDDFTERDNVAAAGAENDIGMDDDTDRDNLAAAAAVDGTENDVGMGDGTDRDNVAAVAAAPENDVGMDDGTDGDNVAAVAAAPENDIGIDDGTDRDNVAAATAGTENDIRMDDDVEPEKKKSAEVVRSAED